MAVNYVNLDCLNQNKEIYIMPLLDAAIIVNMNAVVLCHDHEPTERNKISAFIYINPMTNILSTFFCSGTIELPENLRIVIAFHRSIIYYCEITRHK